ncbi:MAG: metalloregulator ArsR/SmtB family transcription factor [Parvularculaceae bacterium]
MNLDTTLNVFKAIGEETRLRIMVLLLRGELTVSELTQILGQSQPRVSRHLKILADAGLVERYREGSWMFYRAAASGQAGIPGILSALADLSTASDRVIARDRDRFGQSRDARAQAAAAYFQENAAEWDQVRKLHLPESDIESRMRKLAGDERAATFVDLGTGTGRMLELFADRYDTGLGFDLSREMLAVARANLEKAGVAHAQVRHGDIFSVPIESASVDFVCLHQVLHFLTEPAAAVRRRGSETRRNSFSFPISRRTNSNSCAMSTPTSCWFLRRGSRQAGCLATETLTTRRNRAGKSSPSRYGCARPRNPSVN